MICHSVRTVFILQGYLHFSILRSNKALYEIPHSASGLCGFFEQLTERKIHMGLYGTSNVKSLRVTH